MIADEITKEITKKENYVTVLHKKLNKQTNLKIKEATERAKLMSSNLTDKIEGKVTEKAKVAYCDKMLQKETTELKWLENDISKLKRQIELCNDKIACYKYTIKEMEITK